MAGREVKVHHEEENHTDSTHKKGTGASDKGSGTGDKGPKKPFDLSKKAGQISDHLKKTKNSIIDTKNRIHDKMDAGDEAQKADGKQQVKDVVSDDARTKMKDRVDKAAKRYDDILKGNAKETKGGLGGYLDHAAASSEAQLNATLDAMSAGLSKMTGGEGQAAQQNGGTLFGNKDNGSDKGMPDMDEAATGTAATTAAGDASKIAPAPGVKTNGAAEEVRKPMSPGITGEPHNYKERMRRTGE